MRHRRDGEVTNLSKWLKAATTVSLTKPYEADTVANQFTTAPLMSRNSVRSGKRVHIIKSCNSTREYFKIQHCMIYFVHSMFTSIIPYSFVLRIYYCSMLLSHTRRPSATAHKLAAVTSNYSVYIYSCLFDVRVVVLFIWYKYKI